MCDRPPLPPKTINREARTVYMRGRCAVMATDTLCRLRIVCVNCDTRATYGYAPPCPRKKKCGYTLHCGPRWCQRHAPPGAYDVANMSKECSVPGCYRQRITGSKCGRHSDAGIARALASLERKGKKSLRALLASKNAERKVQKEAQEVYCRICDDVPSNVP